jgi:hypothetical protein
VPTHNIIYLEERDGLLYPMGTAGIQNMWMFQHIVPKGFAPIEDYKLIYALADAHCWELLVAKTYKKKGEIK